jgi:hypothetical protein
MQVLYVFILASVVWIYAVNVPMGYACRCDFGPMGAVWGVPAGLAVAAAAGFVFGLVSISAYTPFQIALGWALAPIPALMWRTFSGWPGSDPSVWIWADPLGLTWNMFAIPASGALGVWWGMRERSRTNRGTVWLIAYVLLLVAVYEFTWWAACPR